MSNLSYEKNIVERLFLNEGTNIIHLHYFKRFTYIAKLVENSQRFPSCPKVNIQIMCLHDLSKVNNELRGSQCKPADWLFKKTSGFIITRVRTRKYCCVVDTPINLRWVRAKKTNSDSVMTWIGMKLFSLVRKNK